MSLFDQLVGAALQRHRNGEAERLRGLEVDDELDFRGLLNRQVGWLFALEDAAGVDADLAKQLRNIGSIAHQTTGRGELAIRTDRGNRMAKCQCSELLAACKEEWVGADHQRTGSQLKQRRKDRIEIVIGAGMQDMHF